MPTEKRLTDQSIVQVSVIADNDRIHIVDVSDTTGNPAGTSKFITPLQITDTVLKSIGINGLIFIDDNNHSWSVGIDTTGVFTTTDLGIL